MRHITMALVLAVGFPAAAFAQQAPPAGMGAHGNMMMPHGMSDADRSKMMALHNQARAAILKALTPKSKALLTSIVGALAVAANPDPKAAAAKLDAELSSGEKQAILNSANTMHQQMRAMMPSPPPGHPSHPPHSHMPTDPGELLLMMSAMSVMGTDGMMHAGM